MKLSFYAKPEHMVNRPGTRSVGAPPRYIGRTYKAVEDKAGGVAGAYPAMSVPESFDLSPADPVFADLVRACLKGGVYAADKETAQACGVELVALEQDKESGEWLPRRGAAPTKTAPKPEATKAEGVT